MKRKLTLADRVFGALKTHEILIFAFVVPTLIAGGAAILLVLMCFHGTN